MKTNPDFSPLLIPISSEEARELASIKERFSSLTMHIMDGERFPVDLLEIYPETDDLAAVYDQLTDLKQCLDSFRPFNATQMAHLQEVFDTEYTYASNCIEGNTLTLRETSFVINEGLTIRNKSMKEHLEAINHKEAIAFVRDLVSRQEPFSERTIKLIHALVLHGIDRENAGVYRDIGVGIRGTDIVFSEPYLVPKLMEDFMIYYEKNKDTLHPVRLAAHIHAKLVNIHPFIDGNGRTARLVMNLLLLQHGYPVTIFSPEQEDRDAYFDALNRAREEGNHTPFERFVAKNLKHRTFKYLRFIAPNMGEEEKNKGYYFFKTIESYLEN